MTATGIVGVAVGFGSQILVRDIISGVFYLLYDAFRVGEYIQSGNFKGTVESLDARSLKLRHHRGPIFTVSYRQSGAVENLSRDWVIDKVTVSVTCDTDLDKAKKIVKQIGKELTQDPEFAPNHRAAQNAGRGAVRRLCNSAASEDDDPSGRAVCDLPQGLCVAGKRFR